MSTQGRPTEKPWEVAMKEGRVVIMYLLLTLALIKYFLCDATSRRHRRLRCMLLDVRLHINYIISPHSSRWRMFSSRLRAVQTPALSKLRKSKWGRSEQGLLPLGLEKARLVERGRSRLSSPPPYKRESVDASGEGAVNSICANFGDMARLQRRYQRTGNRRGQI